MIHSDPMPLCKHGDFFQRSPFFPPRPDEQATQSLCCILLYDHKESQTRDTRSTIIATGATNIRRAHDHSDCASYCDWSCVYIPCEPDLCIRAGVGKLSPLLIPVVECPSHRGVRRTASLARGPAREIGSRLASSRCVPGTLTNPFHHC